MKIYLYSALIVLFAAYTFIGCSDDSESSSSFASDLEMNGMPINIYSNIDGEWDSRDGFRFWVNGVEVIAHDDGVYIQGKITRTDDDIHNNTLTINVGDDVTDRFSILLEYECPQTSKLAKFKQAMRCQCRHRNRICRHSL